MKREGVRKPISGSPAQLHGNAVSLYADDSNIYVRSERAGMRVLDSIERFLSKKLKLKVNRQKSAVGRPQERKFLGFSFTSGKHLKIKLSKKALQSVKRRIKQITRRSRGTSLQRIINDLSEYLRGWYGYYRLIETPSVLKDLDSWIRRRLRCFVMKQWIKNCRTRFNGLRSLGVSENGARPVAGSRKGPWAMSNMKPVKVAMPNRFFADRGLFSLSEHFGIFVKTT